MSKDKVTATADHRGSEGIHIDAGTSKAHTSFYESAYNSKRKIRRNYWKFGSSADLFVKK